MPEYRLYHFKRGHIERADNLRANDDLEAGQRAGEMVDHQTAELWRGARKLRVFNPPAESS